MNWFAGELLTWFDRHGRRDLPWQQQPTPYRVWISEIMLQQTQVATVIPYFERFMARFPDVAALARADLDEVLHLWTGLGYYARARNLHRSATIITAEHGGELPASSEQLIALPGIGRSTAGAILAIAHGQRTAILDGNVKRVLARFHAEPGRPGQSAWLHTLWQHAEHHTPPRRLADYTQAIMDLGATVCTRRRPNCIECPLTARCEAFRDGTTEQFPETKPRRRLAVKRVRMFLIEAPDGHILLERRPPTGLWGGLWGPPERAHDQDPATLAAELGMGQAAVRETRTEAGFRHTFTHFHMDIEPVRIILARPAPPAIGEAGRLRWYHPRAGDRIGLSAAAVRLLAERDLAGAGS